MHLRRLRLAGIGPFMSEYTIDFDTLSHSGLFLLEGPTGAGKSMLIDAIVFALYGKPASDQVSEERLRSHHADPGTRSWVELVFETDTGIYRVHRTPAYMRAKSRGTGTTPQNATARLVRVTSADDGDGGEVISTSAQEVGTEIAALLGLTRGQFAQTVVLPQGEFAAFLRSNAEDRRAVLESIFRTHIYEDIATELIDARKHALEDQRHATERISRAAELLASVTTRDGVPPSGLDRSDDPDALAERATELVTACKDEETRLRAHRDQCMKRDDAARADYEKLQKLAEMLERRASLLDRRSKLAAVQPEIDAASSRVRLARQAASVRSALQAQERAASALSDAREVLETARATFGAGASSVTAAELDDGIAGLIELAAKLRDLKSLQEALAAKDQKLQELADEIGRLEEQQGELESAIALRATEKDRLDAELADAQEARLALPEAEQQLQRTHDVAVAVRRRDEHSQTLAEQERVLTNAVEHARMSAQHVADLRQQQINGMAGELASHLDAKESCPVCGSTSHPAPARLAEHHPSQDAIDSAERLQQEAQGEVREAQRQYERIDAELTATSETAGDISRDEAEHAASQANENADRLRHRANRFEYVTAEIADFDQNANRQDSQDTDTREKLATLRNEHMTQQNQIDQDRKQINAELEQAPESITGAATPGSVVEFANVVEQRRVQSENLRDALRGVDEADTRLRECDQDLDNALSETGFDSVEDARSAALADVEIDRLDGQITNHNGEWAAVTEGLNDPAIASLSGEENPDLESASKTVQEAADEFRIAQEGLSSAENVTANAVSAQEKLTGAIASNWQIIAKTAPVVRMAGIAEASDPANHRRVTLGSYVLLRRFEDVLKAANDRLGPMSAGRFRIVRSDETERRGQRKAGLALRLMDHKTGIEREPRTLSGGQTFYTSLSLALGLADVVTAESGGVRLGTLFIDEGFGTLDVETLDNVMAELGALSSGGRLVGVVSHVSELKQRISDRISVRPNNDGSSSIRVRGSMEP